MNHSTSMRLRPTTLIIPALAAAVIFAFWPLHRNGFIESFDDSDYILNNPHVTTGLRWENIKWAFTNFHSANWHPVTWISHMADCQLFGNHAPGHHFTNLLLHLLNAVLLFLLFRSLTGAVWRSALAAFLFALHPLHVESVAWASERKDTLSTLFWFLTALAYVRSVRRADGRWYVAALLLFSAALMSKPMAVSAPLTLLLLDYWPLCRINPVSRDGDRPNAPGLAYLLKEKVPFLLLSTVVGIVTILAQRSYGAVRDLSVLPLPVRLSNATLGYVRYLIKMVWPADLVAHYPHPETLSLPHAAAAAAALAALSLAVFLPLRRNRWAAMGWLWYLITLIPVIGLVQVGSQSIADRYTYIPFVGLFVVVSWGSERIARLHRRGVRVTAVLWVCVLTALGITTFRQVGYWQDDITLFGHAARVYPSSFVAHNNLGTALLRTGRREEAMAHFGRALQLEVNSFALNNMGTGLFKMGEARAAIPFYRAALQADPGFGDAFYNLALAHAELGEDSTAERYYRIALQHYPDRWQTHFNLGQILRRLGRTEEAIVHLGRALHLDPGNGKILLNRARALLDLQRIDEALKDYRAVLERYPNDAALRALIVDTLNRQGYLSAAQALESPRNPEHSRVDSPSDSAAPHAPPQQE